MELIDIIPEFNLYEEYWKIYTNSGILPPHYISDQSAVEKSIIGNGCDIYGEVHSSVISSGVTIGKGSVVRAVSYTHLTSNRESRKKKELSELQKKSKARKNRMYGMRSK